MTLPLWPKLSGATVVSLLLLAAAFGTLQLLASGSSPTAPAEAVRSAADATLDRLSLNFIENRGQIDRRAEYYLPGKDTSVYFTRDGLSLSLADKRRTGRRYGLKLDFVGARAGARPVGRAKTPAVVSYFKGARADWKAGIPTYSEVAYRDLWPGIDLVYSGAGSQLKYSFLVQPGADPGAIQLAWQGANGVDLTRGGQLRVSTPAGVVRDDAPYSYQTVGGKRRKVGSSYALAAGHGYGFRVGGYDRSRPLVIDPAMLVYSGFIGGSGDEAANNVDLDGAGNLYVTGPTTSTDFPAVVGPDTTANGGLNDGFVAKVKADGSGLDYASYIGGSDFDQPINIAVDGAGAAYVGGSTGSSESEGFPVTVGPDVTYNGGPQDAWVAKLNPAGTSLVYAGYIGGRGTGLGDTGGAPNEQANGIDVDAAGNAYLAGFTKSNESADANGGFPDGDGFGALPGFDKTYNSSAPPLPDAWSAKVNATGSALLYATYLGGGNADAGTGLTVDSTGVYMNVFTSSNQNPYDFTTNALGGFPRGEALGPRPGFDQTFNGPSGPGVPVDAAAFKLNTTGTDLIYWTYIGGAGSEQPFGNTVDSGGNVYMTGRTSSSQASFPDGDGFGTVPGFDQTYNGGTADPDAPGGDAFVVKLNAAGTGLVYGTYVGGSEDELPVGIALDPADDSAHIAGMTESTEATFPTTNGPDSTYNGGESDAFVARLTPSGTGLTYAGFIGGSLAETGLAMAVDADGNAYTAGSTDSSQCRGFPVTRGPDLTFEGPFASTNAFVAKIDPTGAAAEPLPNQPPGCAAPPGPGPSAVPPAPAPAPFPDCPTLTAGVIRGTAASETIKGTPRADRIFAGSGNDRVDGLASNDCIDLGPGTDRGQGGSGADLIVGGLGRDRMSGSSGLDRLRGGASGDRLIGGSGNDRLDGQTGGDVITGGSSGDRIVGGQGNDRIIGDSGNDSITGNSGRDRLTGSSGRDSLSGGSGNDRIDARDGQRDRISCGSGRDTVTADRIDRVTSNCERVRRP